MSELGKQLITFFHAVTLYMCEIVNIKVYLGDLEIQVKVVDIL